jgi:ATP-dependent exoDNAse (exonuclease V) alpha subunit
MTASSSTFTPTAGQEEAIQEFRLFMKTPFSTWPVFTLCGFAGTGKTTLVKHLVDTMRESVSTDVSIVRVVAPTGKASSVLRKKGFTGATTVHALLYTPRVVKKYHTTNTDDSGYAEVIGEELVFSLKTPDMAAGTKLIVVDEASMVDDEMSRDLLSLGIKILAIGDPFQLPPVKTSTSSLLDVEKPDAMLTEVTRQAHDSPVLHLATVIRESQQLLRGRFGDSVVCTKKQADNLSFTGEAPFIVGLNRTRHAQNFSIRQLLGRKSWAPEPGDRLLCRRNDKKTGLINGEIHIVVETFAVSDISRRVTLKIRPETFTSEELVTGQALSREVHAWSHLFKGEEGETELGRMRMSARRACQELTWGYAITCHASQGSEWPTVVVMDEGESFREFRWRWLYTAITRASERVAVIS